MDPQVDVIIPVFGGAPQECAAGAALREAHCETPFALAMASSIEEVARAHGERDVVVLSPHARVCPGWLDRLRAAARDEAQVATVSPFSNDGEVCGYPAPWRTQELPQGTSPATLDAICATHNAGIRFEVPRPSSFCMYVTRRAIDEAGPVIEDGSMEGFLRRVREAGMRHIACADVFVAHAASEGLDTTEKHRAQALAAEPELAKEWIDYTTRDPARPLRRRIDHARLRATPRPRLLFISHAWGGGVERHVNELAQLLANDCEVLLLKPEGENAVTLRWLREGEEFEAWFDRATDWIACVELLRALAISRAHFHHFHGWPQDIVDLPRLLGVPYDVTLHDHTVMCAQYHLADEEGRYCGEPDEAGCNACIARRPAQWPLDIAQWRAFFHEVLRQADRVIAPSNDLATRVRRHFPDIDIAVWPHPDLQAEPPVAYKVLILGGLSLIKGLRHFERVLEDVVERQLPLHFRIIGHTEQPVRAPEGAPFTISGSYRESDLQRLIALERPDAFLFLSRVPESFSYTLSAAMGSGLPVVATRIGAFKERLASYPSSRLVAPDGDGASVNDALLALLRQPAAASAARPAPVPLERAR